MLPHEKTQIPSTAVQTTQSLLHLETSLWVRQDSAFVRSPMSFPAPPVMHGTRADNAAESLDHDGIHPDSTSVVIEDSIVTLRVRSLYKDGVDIAAFQMSVGTILTARPLSERLLHPNRPSTDVVTLVQGCKWKENRWGVRLTVSVSAMPTEPFAEEEEHLKVLKEEDLEHHPGAPRLRHRQLLSFGSECAATETSAMTSSSPPRTGTNDGKFTLDEMKREFQTSQRKLTAAATTEAEESAQAKIRAVLLALLAEDENMTCDARVFLVAMIAFFYVAFQLGLPYFAS
jgi:hypothetical protein